VLERELEQLIHLLTDSDIGIARIVTNRMNARTRVAAIGHLIEWYVYHDRIAPSFLKQFGKLGNRITTQTQTKRDMLVHGLWSVVDGEWWVLRLVGQRATPELRPDLDRLSRALLPQRESITREKLDAIIEQIVSDARAVQAFCDELCGVLAPSRYTPPAYTRRRRNIPKKKVAGGQ
jgi:hypothetical protein